MSKKVTVNAPDPRILEMAERSKNFGFLLPHLQLLVAYGVGAEAAVFSDPNVALIKARQFGEVLAADLVRRGRVRVEGDRQIDRLRALEREGYLHGTVGDAFGELRAVGNEAVHKNLADPAVAFHALQSVFRLGVWFDRLLTGTREVRVFIPPQLEKAGDEPAALRAEIAAAGRVHADSRLTFADGTSQGEAERKAREAAERDLAEAQDQQVRLAEIVAAVQAEMEALQSSFDAARHAEPVRGKAAVMEANRERERLLGNAASASREPLTEIQVRERLDEMLADAGWSVQDHDNRLNLYAGTGVAVREVTTGAGRADYALYVEGRLVGVIEAKREGADLSAAEVQADRYAENLTSGLIRAAWRDQLPFRYSSDGGETRFRNALDPDSRTRRVFSFHQPRTLARWMRQADDDPVAPTYRARLRTRMPALTEAGLRPAQVAAVKGVELSLTEGRGQAGMGQSRSLVQMATGAGKTFTAVTFSYRLLKHARAERVLFLVDRNNLGVQAKAEFDNYTTPDTGRKFTELYNVQRLAAEPVEPSAKVVVATVQRLYVALTGRQVPEPENGGDITDAADASGSIDVSYNAELPPEAFDLVIVDECHRSIYGRWRAVLEYFDAPVVGLTATPVAQTFGYFNRNLVSEYTYDEAVADGVNVPFNVYRIETEITGRGGVIARGVIPMRDRRTRRQRYEDIDDDVQYTAREVGTKVIAKDQLRTVIRTFHDRLFADIFPERAKREPDGGLLRWDEMYVPKTLVFAKDDNHAEEIVEVVRDVFGKGNDFCAKITHAARKPGDLLADFRNSAKMRIAVTVDMIATGTDVKPLECLLFLRDVRSWAYFEQMKGRGSRTLSLTEFERVTPGVGPKNRFVIVDAVGVTQHPKVDAAPQERHTEQQISLERLLMKTANGTVSDSEVSTLAARLAKLNLQLTDSERAEIERETGIPLTAIVRGLTDAVSVDGQERAREQGGEAAVRQLVRAAVRPLASDEKLRIKLLEMRRAKDILYDETSKDRLIHAGPVLDDEAGTRALLRGWRDYIREHEDEIAVFSAVYSRPGITPREAFQRLQDVARSLERPPRAWTPDRLWRAYEQVGEAVVVPGAKHGVTDLVALLRYELSGGAEAGHGPVQPYATRVEQRFAEWLARQEQAGARYNERQLWWLRRIAEATAARVRFDFADFSYPPFSSRNGAYGFLEAFGEVRADEILDELDRELIA